MNISRFTLKPSKFGPRWTFNLFCASPRNVQHPSDVFGSSFPSAALMFVCHSPFTFLGELRARQDPTSVWRGSADHTHWVICRDSCFMIRERAALPVEEKVGVRQGKDVNVSFSFPAERHF